PRSNQHCSYYSLFANSHQHSECGLCLPGNCPNCPRSSQLGGRGSAFRLAAARRQQQQVDNRRPHGSSHLSSYCSTEKKFYSSQTAHSSGTNVVSPCEILKSIRGRN